MYALSFAEYFVSILPGFPIKLIAFLFITFMYLINLFGVKSAAKLQTGMMVVLLLALALFAINGLPKVNFDTFKGATLFTGGYRGFFTATALLTFACGGAVVIAEVGGEMKNPGRDIPIAIIVSTICVGALYAFISIVAVGVLPLEDTAFQPLSNVAKAILPTPLFYFFIIGGAMAALATTLNAVFTWLPKAILIACQDGWLPKGMGVVNKKFGTPHIILTIIYLIGIVPVISGLSLQFISQLGTAAIQIANILPILSALFLVKKYPEAHKNSKFKFSAPVLAVIVGVSIVLQLIQGYFLLSDLPKTALFAAAVYIVIAAIYTLLRSKKTVISRDF
jgi:APA family basic amino acid/polyamine antiporter